MPPTFPHTQVKSVTFSNYSGTIRGLPVPLYCTPEGGTDRSVLRLHGDAVRSILQYCFTQDPPARLRALGSTWSFSRIIEPAEVALDTANFTFIERVPSEHFTSDYQRLRVTQGFSPIFIEGGTQIAGINRRLGHDLRLALQTSGAGDGHRLAGCLATGTHGSAFRLGAVHDTVLGLYLVVAPDRAVFVQSGSAPAFTGAIAGWLEQQTGIPTENRADDQLFHAAQVSLGSLGIVFGVVMEMAPLYRLKYKSVPRPRDDQQVWHAIRTLDTSALHPEVGETPHHFDVVMHPYPPGGGAPGLVATMMWKVPAGGLGSQNPLPTIPRASSDLMGLVSRLADALGSGLTAPLALPLLRHFISDQIGLHAATGEAFPGEIFGPTTLPPGSGASTEIVVHHELAERAVGVVDRVLQERERHGEFLLGAMGVRFVPGTRAWLGMNIAPRNCYIELPSVRSDAVLGIYRAVWDALEQDGVPFTCHWGQLHGLNPSRLERYFGAQRLEAWKAARRALLSPVAQRVFAAPILAEVGLST